INRRSRYKTYFITFCALSEAKGMGIKMKNVLPATFLVFFTFVAFGLYFLYQLGIFTIKIMVLTL
ncbi:hypothetical protein, partial [uncultured Metabacillus sp.]|uniref:hypothetical protein n=1 Tax=uncultured Metabacillus sp. TaxID=2860135 RepID=UPI0026237F44